MILRIMFGRFSGTDRTAAFLCSCTGIDGGQPFVAVGAPPPDPFCASGKHHIGFQRHILLRVPLGSHQRLHGFQIIKSRQYFSVCTVRAVGPLRCPIRYLGLPFMPSAAFPPDPSVAEHRDLLRTQCSVFLSVPLLCQLWRKAFQVIFSGIHNFSGTNRTACALAAGHDSCFPFMPLFAPPPYLLSTTGRNRDRR